MKISRNTAEVLVVIGVVVLVMLAAMLWPGAGGDSCETGSSPCEEPEAGFPLR